MFLWNFGICLQVHTAIRPRIPTWTSSPPRDPLKFSPSCEISRRRVWSLESSGMMIHRPVDGGSTHLWNVRHVQRDYTALHLRTLNFIPSCWTFVAYSTFQFICRIAWGLFSGTVSESSSYLFCQCIGMYMPTSRRNILPPSSGLEWRCLEVYGLPWRW
jgi:hypothetical protein